MKPLLLFGIGLLLSTVAFTQSNKGERYFQEAKSELDKGELEKAARAFLQARAEFQREKELQRYWSATQAAAIIYQDTDKGAEAERILLEAVRFVPLQTKDDFELHSKIQDNLGYTYLYVLGLPAKALAAYQQSIDHLLKAGHANTVALAFEWVNRAVVYGTLYQNQKAIADMEQAIAVYAQDADTPIETLAGYYQSLGNYCREDGQYGKAIESLLKALNLVQTSEDKELLSGIYNDLGIAYQGNRSFAEALRYVEASRDLTLGSYGKDADHYAKRLINLANVYESGGDTEQSMAIYQEIANIYGQSPPSEMQDLIDVLLNLSKLTNELGLTEQTATLVAQAQQLIETSFGAGSLQSADLEISKGTLSYYRSEFDEALSHYFKALHLLEELKFEGEDTYATIYTNIGQAYDELFETELALQYKENALARYRKVNGDEHVNVAMALENIGLTYEMAGQNDKAILQLKTALDKKIKALGPHHEDVATTYHNIGFVYLKDRHTQEAIAYLEKARAIYEPYSHHKMKAMIYNRLGLARYLASQKSEALALFKAAIVANVVNIERMQDIPPQKADYLNYYELVISYLNVADVLSETAELALLKTAEQYMDAADDILRKTAAAMENGRDRLELAQAYFFFTEVGIKVANQRFQATKESSALEKAFYYSERNKSNELLADLKVSRGVSESRLPRKLSIRQKELSIKSYSLEQRLSSAYQSKNLALIQQLKSQQLEVSQEYAKVQNEITTAFPSLLTVEPRSLPSWKTVQSSLPENAALISYTITDSARYVWVGTRTSAQLIELNKKADLEKLIRGYRNFITFKSDLYESTSSKLYDLVWAPVQQALQTQPLISELIIIPDGPLAYVPFETLRKTDFLISKYHIRYELSAALMMAKGPRLEIKKPSFVAIAPVFKDDETNFVNKSCEPLAQATQKADSTSRSFAANGDYIAPLPATEKEVEQIHQIHQDKDLFSQYFTKENASEEMIKKGELKRFDYIHFATHGIANSQYPALSALLMAPRKNSVEDGVLYTGEILSLELKADLVTLSACETALGKRIEGEGVRGLTSAFLLAGARTVVVSLWKVADESTSIFMIEFYNQLLSGKSKTEALHQAKLALMANSAYSHPFYWAPFIQVGPN